MRERLAKLKARAIERVLDELEMEAEKKNMAMLKVELVERLSRVYGEELRRADVADPNKARYVRDSMLACVEEALEVKGWRVLENGSPATSTRRSGGRGMRGLGERRSDGETTCVAVAVLDDEESSNRARGGGERWESACKSAFSSSWTIRGDLGRPSCLESGHKSR